MKPLHVILGLALIGVSGYILSEYWKKDWYRINVPMGKKLGYPDCCVKAFCNQPPQLLKLRGVTIGTPKSDMVRYNASLVNGEFSGFIPCYEHAKKILKGEITIDQLINNRSPEFSAFPCV